MLPRIKNPAFTLIELLVTVAILSVLIAILLPALSKARSLARQAVCGSNLKNIVLANITYASDNNGFFVLAAEDILDMGGNRKRWHGQRKSSGYSTDPEDNRFDPAKGPMADYLADGAFNHCPENVFFDEGFEASAGGYGYNQQYIGGRYFDSRYSSSMMASDSIKASKRSARHEEVLRPAETVMFTDTAIAQSATTMVEYSFCESPYAASGQRLDATIHFRHDGKCNVGWVDGHVDSRLMDFTHAYGAYGVSKEDAERHGLGWFGPDANTYFDLE